MFNVPEVCRRAAETAEIVSELKSKMQHKKPLTSSRSPLQQLLRRVRKRSNNNIDDNEEEQEEDDYAPPEFAGVEGERDVPVAPPAEALKAGGLSAAGVIGEEQVPTIAQAALHLGLLEVFWKYKDQFLRPGDEMKAFFSAAMGSGKEVGEVVWGDTQGVLLWRTVVEIAVGRFEAWWKVVGRETEAAKLGEREGGSGRWEPKDGPGKKVTELPAEMLPPVDVLMVWHSFMLNPRCYYDGCFALGVPGMLAVAFPWEAIVSLHRRHLISNTNRKQNKAIDLKTLDYTLSADAETFFRVATSQDVDVFAQLKKESFSKPRLPMLEIICPKCEHEHELPIASLDLTANSWHKPGLSLGCACGFAITHDSLCAERLRQDYKQVLAGGPGIRGTFSPPFERGSAINTLIKETFVSTPPTLSTHPTVANLLSFLPNPQQVAPFYLPTSPQSSACISLTAAVIRQETFVDKMHHFLWLRSPTLSTGTLPRAREKYTNFFRLFSLFPGEIMVPTLDLDLFWHTHQLTPARYYYFCLQPSAAGRFIDHNDKLPTGVLDNGFERTGERYRDTFGLDYGGCFCWACEIERDELTPDRGWWMHARRERKKRWERRVKIAFWREVERHRSTGGEQVGLKGLEKVLAEGPKRR